MLRGGELVSNDLYGYGSYSARMKLPDALASIAGFFLYQPPDYASEIDIEIYNAIRRAESSSVSTQAGARPTRRP